jgi:hypothetical protein
MSGQHMQPFDPARWGLQAYRNGSAPRASDNDDDDMDVDTESGSDRENSDTGSIADLENGSDKDSPNTDSAAANLSRQVTRRIVDHVHNPGQALTGPQSQLVASLEQALEASKALVVRLDGYNAALWNALGRALDHNGYLQREREQLLIGDTERPQDYVALFAPFRHVLIQREATAVQVTELATTLAKVDLAKGELDVFDKKIGSKGQKLKKYDAEEKNVKARVKKLKVEQAQLKAAKTKRKEKESYTIETQINNTYIDAINNFGQVPAQAYSPQLAVPALLAPPTPKPRPQASSPSGPATPQLRDKAPLGVGPVHA